MRLVRFTENGKRMSRTVVAVERRVEREQGRRIGARNVTELRRILAMDWASRLRAHYA